MAWLVHVLGWILHPAIACFELPVRAGKQDLRMAIWLWHNDLNPVRGKATALCYIANGAQKTALLSYLPLFVIGGVAYLFGVNAIPADIFVSCILVALTTSAVAMVLAGLIGFSGLLRAYRAGIRLWIDETPSVEYAMAAWPPATGTENQAAVFAIYPVFPLLIIGVMAVPEKWMYHTAACLLLFVPPILWLGHKTIAETVEECYNEANFSSEETAP